MKELSYTEVLALTVPAKGRPVRELVAEAQQQESLAELRKTAADLTTAPVGRGPLLALIGHSDHADGKDDASFQRLTGVPVDAKLDAVGWATWIFRELQAAKAASNSSSAKRRATKKA